MPERPLLSDLVRNTHLALTNRLRMMQRHPIDYVALRLSGPFPERTPQPPRRPFPLSLVPWPPPPPSVQAFQETLERLSADPRVKGALLLVSDLSAGPATLSSLRDAILRFRRANKQAIAYLHDLNMWSYYLASACDRIVVPESTSFLVAGLWTEVLFLRDTLALLGLEADLEAIGVYKTAPDTFRRTQMSEPHRQMLESLLDSLYTEVIHAVADGRKLPAERIRELFDAVPLTAGQALEAGLVDAVCYEDELPRYLGTPAQPAVLVTGEQAGRRLIRPRHWHSRHAVGIIRVEGIIVTGHSRQPPSRLPIPVAGVQAGSDTLRQQIRAAAQNRHIAAVILSVDSPGGSALASDLIWREVVQLRRVKPVVVFMGNRAASGGYYVSAAASAIVAQPTTLTGSIGIWGGKVVTQELFEKIHAGREVVSRGRAAGLYSDSQPFTEEQRERVRAEIGAGYLRFKARVAEGRNMSDEQVEAVASGRVWTGEQALAHGLVDELGDLYAAVTKARELAGLDMKRTARLVNMPIPRQYRLPVTPEAEVGEWLAGLKTLLDEHLFAIAPWLIRIRG